MAATRLRTAIPRDCSTEALRMGKQIREFLTWLKRSEGITLI
jgi:hypothetical protein